MNLLTVPGIKTALRSRLFPVVFQWITISAFGTVILSALFGVNNAGQNFGMALAWRVWWPLLPLSFLFLGRFWCAICPFAWITDWIQKAVGVRLPVPRPLRRYGPWLIGGSFILLSYLDEAWGFSNDARKTGYLLLAVLATVIFFAAFFERRAFCRYVCFVGAFAANYSRAGMLELRADRDRCRDCSAQGCYRGTSCTAGCPVFLLAPGVTDSGTCELCANCVKNCPRDALRVSTRKPAKELWSVEWSTAGACLSDAILAMMVAGAVLIEQFAQAGGWNRMVAAVGATLHLDPYGSFPFLYAALLAMFIAAPLLGSLLAACASQGLAGRVNLAALKQSFSFLGYAVIPLALASHVAHGLDRVLTWSRSVPFALASIAGCFPANNRAAWLPWPAVFWIEVGVLALGAAASLYVSFRLSTRTASHARWIVFAPNCLLLLLLLAANLYPVLTRVP